MKIARCISAFASFSIILTGSVQGMTFPWEKSKNIPRPPPSAQLPVAKLLPPVFKKDSKGKTSCTSSNQKLVTQWLTQALTMIQYVGVLEKSHGDINQNAAYLNFVADLKDDKDLERFEQLRNDFQIMLGSISIEAEGNINHHMTPILVSCGPKDYCKKDS